MKAKLHLIIGLASLTTAVSGAAAGRDTPSGPANIILLFVDDLGWMDVGFQGGPVPTPHIDALAQSGIVFERAYAAAPTCSPSRAGLLTGQHPARLRVVRHVMNPEGVEFTVSEMDPARMPSRNWLPRGTPTIASSLKSVGFDTVFLGKWHLGEGAEHYPTAFGFDRQIGATPYGQPRNFLAPYWPDPEYADAPEGEYLTDRQTNDAVACLRKHREDVTKQPLFLMLSYYAVHTPKIGRPDYVVEAKAAGWKGDRAEYFAMIRSLDDSVGRIVAELEALGIRADTCIVFASDQGSYFDQPPLQGSKTDGTALFEGGARVPFIISWPSRVAAGSRNSQPISLTDVYPTLLEIAGAVPDHPELLDGTSLLPAMVEGAPVGRSDVILYRSYGNQDAALIEGPWKLIAYRDGSYELYNYERDISEKENLADKEPELTARLIRRFEAWESSLGIDLEPGAVGKRFDVQDHRTNELFASRRG